VPPFGAFGGPDEFGQCLAVPFRPRGVCIGDAEEERSRGRRQGADEIEEHRELPGPDFMEITGSGSRVLGTTWRSLIQSALSNSSSCRVRMVSRTSPAFFISLCGLYFMNQLMKVLVLQRVTDEHHVPHYQCQAMTHHGDGLARLSVAGTVRTNGNKKAAAGAAAKPRYDCRCPLGGP